MLDTLELVNLARQPPRGALPSSHFPFSIHLAVKRISSNFINGLRRGEIPASRSGIDLRRRRINRVINRSSRSSLIKSSLVVAVSPFLPSRRVPPLPPSLDKRRKWNRGEADARKKKEREYSKERGRGREKKEQQPPVRTKGHEERTLINTLMHRSVMSRSGCTR